jgi:lipopolysaccharide transport system permease protein
LETKPILVIKPKRGWQLVDFRELSEYRDLLYFMVSRDIKVRYRQTVLGGLWAIIQPLFMMVIFTLFFGNLAKVPSDGIPYPIFNYSAMVAWTYFSNALSFSSNSLMREMPLVSKVYFPRMLAPFTPVVTYLLDFLIAFVILIGMMVFYHIYPTMMILLLPLLLILLIVIVTGFGLFLSAWSVKYRDVIYAVPFLLQFWMFASPVVYPLSILPQKYHVLYALNPMTGVIEGFRSVLLGKTTFPTQTVLISSMVAIVVLILGALYFRRTERSFADII